MDPGHIHLPALFDPVLNYLARTLPHPLYTFLLNLLAHCLALVSALLDLLASLLSKSPSEWDAQTVLPPLVTLLAAYLALISVYRTASWMIRTSFWFIKWGIILGALVAGTSWYIGLNQGQAGGLINTGLISYLGNLALDKINGQNRNAVGGERMQRMGGPRPVRKPLNRPKPWESFDRHQEWQYDEHQTETGEASELEVLMKNLFGAATRVLGEDSWWTGLKSVMDISGGSSGSSQTAEENSNRVRAETGGKSRSR